MDDLREFGRAAKDEIRSIFREVTRAGAAVSYKDGGLQPREPVTKADIGIQKFLDAKLTALIPGSVVIGEESFTPEHLEAALSARFVWVVDPLDGTAVFAKGGKDYCTAVLLLDHGKPVYGFIYAPAWDIDGTGESFFEASEDRDGVTLNDAPLNLSPASRLAEALVYTNRPQTLTKAGRIPKYFDQITSASAGEIVNPEGSSGLLGQMRVLISDSATEKKPSLYMQPQPKPWDILQGAFFVYRAGGDVSYDDGSSVFGIDWKKLSLETGSPRLPSIILGAPKIQREVVQMIAGQKGAGARLTERDRGQALEGPSGLRFLEAFSAAVVTEEVDTAEEVEAIKNNKTARRGLAMIALLSKKGATSEKISLLFPGIGNGNLLFVNKVIEFYSKGVRIGSIDLSDLEADTNAAIKEMLERKHAQANEALDLAMIGKDNMLEWARELSSIEVPGNVELTIERFVPERLARDEAMLGAWFQAQEAVHRFIKRKARNAKIHVSFRFVKMDAEGRLSTLLEDSDLNRQAPMVRLGELNDGFLKACWGENAIFTEPLFDGEGMPRLMPDGMGIVLCIAGRYGSEEQFANLLSRATQHQISAESARVLKGIKKGTTTQTIRKLKLVLQPLGRIAYSLINVYRMVAKAVGAAA